MDIDHPLIGKKVRVTLARKGDPERIEIDLDNIEPIIPMLLEDVAVEGKLMRINDEGDFDIQLDDGTMRYCWPALEVEEIK